MSDPLRQGADPVSSAPDSGQGLAAVLDAHETMLAILLRRGADSPDAIFARNVAGDTLSWGALRTAAFQWADRFIELGVGRGDVVVTILDAGMEAMSIWLGLAAIGAVDAGVSAELRGAMLDRAIATCAPALVVVDARYLERFAGTGDSAGAGLTALVIGDGGDGQAATGRLARLVRPETLGAVQGEAERNILLPGWHDIACITFTSGTTGPSKAVRMPWGQLLSINLAAVPFEDLDSSDILYCFTSHAHFGSKSIPYQAAMAGGQVVMRSRFSLSAFWDDISRYGITTASLVGSMADVLMQSPTSPPPTTTLRNLFMAPLGPSYRQFSERFDLRICTVYNSTENGVPICSGWNPQSANTVGKLRPGFPGFDVRIVDEHDREVPDGTPGECIVRSAVPWTMNAGYLNNAEATALAWRNGWFHTGDALLRTAEGNFLFVDRLKDVIRRRGENISSFEVETEVRGNPEVAECAAVAVPAETSEEEILLFATLKPGSTLTAAELGADLAARMPRFMVPRYIELIDAFPKTIATERIVKAELRARGIGPNSWDRERRAMAAAGNGPCDNGESR